MFDGFFEHCGGADRAASVLRRMSTSIEGLLALEAAVPGPEALKAERVFEALVPENDHKANLALRRFLKIAYGVDTSISNMQHVCLRRFIARRLVGFPAWISDTAHAFMGRLEVLRQRQLAAGVTRGSTPVAWKSLELSFRYAHELMTSVHERGGVSVQAISQADVDNYCLSHPKVFRSLAAFVHYLNETSHRAGRLELPTAPVSRSSRVNFMGQAAFDHLVARLLREEKPSDARYACIALFSLLYLRTSKVVLSLRRDQVVDDGERMLITFPGSSGQEEIHPGVAALLRRWLENWSMHSRSVNEENTPFVFPGLSPGQHVGATAFHSWLKSRYGVKARQLRASGIHVMVNSGMVSPAALIDHYGLSPATAAKYWTDSGRDIGQFLYLNTAAITKKRGGSHGANEAV